MNAVINFSESNIEAINGLIYKEFVVDVAHKILSNPIIANEVYEKFKFDIQIFYKLYSYNPLITSYYKSCKSFFSKIKRSLKKELIKLKMLKNLNKKRRKKLFNYIRSNLRLIILSFIQSCFYIAVLNKEQAVQKFAYSIGCAANLIGLTAFDKNNNPRG